MILTYTDVKTGDELDRVTTVGKRVTYKTGKSKSMFEASISRYGVKATELIYADWSNGYVRTHQIE